MAYDGQLPHVVLPSGELRFAKADLLAWIEAHKQPTATQDTKDKQ
jgi:hypothetical protein